MIKDPKVPTSACHPCVESGWHCFKDVGSLHNEATAYGATWQASVPLRLGVQEKVLSKDLCRSNS
eukprot:4133870-Amphidinium_carterae.2